METIVNILFVCSNIPVHLAPACAVFISRLIRYSIYCVFYQDLSFLHFAKMFVCICFESIKYTGMPFYLTYMFSIQLSMNVWYLFIISKRMCIMENNQQQFHQSHQSFLLLILYFKTETEIYGGVKHVNKLIKRCLFITRFP